MPTAADGSDGGHRAVPCSQLALDIDTIGPRGRAGHQGFTLFHFSAQPEPFLTLNTCSKRLNDLSHPALKAV
jgi:hypothetical protein